jgi:drug/metabolite transporter (DMT)-like permease
MSAGFVSIEILSFHFCILDSYILLLTSWTLTMTDAVTAAEFICLSAAWGSVFLFIHLALIGNFVAEVFVALRLVIATAVAFLVFAVRCFRDPSFTASVKARLSWLLLVQFAAMGLFNQAVPYLLITYASDHIGSGLISLLIASQPFFLIVLAALFMRSEWHYIRSSRLRWAGLLAGFAGVALILVNQYEQGSQGGSAFLGVVLLIAANVSFAIASLFAQKYIMPIEPLYVLVGQLFFAMCIMLLAATVRNAWALQEKMSPTNTAVWALFYCGFIASGVAFFLFFDLLRRIGSVRLNMINFLVPFFGVLLGTAVNGEFRNATAAYLACLVVGSTLILCGVVLISFRSPSQPGEVDNSENSPAFVPLRSEDANGD